MLHMFSAIAGFFRDFVLVIAASMHRPAYAQKPNSSVELDEELLRAARELARQRQQSFEQIRSALG